ncbi:YjbH domain-containing protein [Desulfurobacterium sp.]
MKRAVKIVVASLTLIAGAPAARGYSDPINILGITGYILTPSAYLQTKKSLTVGAAATSDFKNIFVSSVPFPGLEGSVSYDTENDKNVSLNIKYQFLPETKHLPTIAFGINAGGSSAFNGSYVAVSKYLDAPIPQTITVGYGTGIYKNLFAGSEILIHPRLTLITEYIEPDREKISKLNIEPVIHANFGLKLMPLNNMQVIFYYNFGKDAGVNLNYSVKF